MTSNHEHTSDTDLRIALATCQEWPRLTEEDQVLAAHLDSHGMQTTAACWDDSETDWAAFDAIVIRSCWDYHLRPLEFRAWLEGLEQRGCVVWNPVRQLLWNSRKTYLRELRAKGVEMVPTRFLAPGAQAGLGELMDDLASDELVIKPTYGASAHGLWIASRQTVDRDQPRLDEALRTDELMVQPLMREIQQAGEWSLMFFGGELSHAVNKLPKAGDIRVQEELGGTSTLRTPPPALVDAATEVLRTAGEQPLYARVDLIEVDGRGVLMELELIEPWLYFQDDLRSLDRFREALLHRLER